MCVTVIRNSYSLSAPAPANATRAVANGVKLGRKPTLTYHQRREAIKRRDKDGEMLRSIARSYNVSAATISRLAA